MFDHEDERESQFRFARHATITVAVVFALAACGAGARPVHGRITGKDHHAAHATWTIKPRYRRTCTTSTYTSGKKTRTRRTCRTTQAGTKRVAHRTAECWELHLSDGRHVCVSSGRWHAVHVGDRL